ncbi:MAG: hypothetical protein ACO3ZZ_01080 [Solirubrobacterales bacterium]
MTDGDGRVGIGEEVEIVAIDGLTLLVRHNGGELTERADESEVDRVAEAAVEPGTARPSEGDEG